MPFLEAMAMGKAVVANNAPTMNEYIQHNINGYLIDFRNPKEIDFSNIETIKLNAHNSIIKGYETWKNNSFKIIEFINENKTKKPKLTKYMFKSILQNLLSFEEKNGKYLLKILFIKFRF